MIQIPAHIQTQYKALLVKKTILDRYHFHYLKWLRYYLDFCLKYKFNQSDKESLPHFINKLREKNQNEQQQKQASDAISIYYEIEAAHSGKNTTFKNKNVIISTKNVSLKPKNANWTQVYDDLNAEIKIRHYSLQTLKAYTGWVRQFQSYAKSKDPQLLSAADIKDFLTFLAVKRKVAASSQNQAFNALLFFFKYIIKKELGDLKDIPRVKRKPYIPVVLSRDEIDVVIAALSSPYDLVVKLLYGCGLRLFECMNLRVGCFNFDTGILTVHVGKGKKDRTVRLPEIIIPELKTQLESVVVLHRDDIDSGYAGAFLFDSIERKYKNAAKELVWQWFFPAKTLTFVPDK